MFSNRLKTLRKKKNLKQDELASLLNISNSAISSYERGLRTPDFELLIRMAKFFEVSTDYLLGIDVVEVSDDYVSIPVLGVIRAGEPILAEQNIIEYQKTARDLLPKGDLFYLQVTGNSMDLSGIHDGSRILVRQQREVENGEIAVVIVNGDDATVKKFYRHGDMVNLVPHSSDSVHQVQIYDLNETDIMVVGRVEAVWKTF